MMTVMILSISFVTRKIDEFGPLIMYPRMIDMIKTPNKLLLEKAATILLGMKESNISTTAWWISSSPRSSTNAC